jgi:hypothetical protein
MRLVEAFAEGEEGGVRVRGCRDAARVGTAAKGALRAAVEAAKRRRQPPCTRPSSSSERCRAICPEMTTRSLATVEDNRASGRQRSGTN